ncbi:hypothetical protein MRX96_058943 [Rhipicephalus microplus]
MAFWTYRLTGFGDCFEQRRVSFAEPMPADRVCSICGRIQSNAVHLACAHILCLRCKVEVCDAKKCPLDGTAITEKELLPFETDACYLERRRVVSVVDGRKCSSNFSGKLSELKRHLASCRDGDLHCAKCNRPVAREAAAEHYRKCCETNSTRLSATDARVRKAVEEIRGIKEDFESLQQKALNERDSEDELVNGVNGFSFAAKGNGEQVKVMFVIRLQAGQWGDYVEWPCSKKFALVIMQPRDETNDIRLALCIDRDKAAKKPCPSRLNEDGYRTEMITWDDIELCGYTVKDTLFVNVEVE